MSDLSGMSSGFLLPQCFRDITGNSKLFFVFYAKKLGMGGGMGNSISEWLQAIKE